MLMQAVSAFVVGLLVYAAWRDLLTRTIPDTVSIGLVALGLSSRMADGLLAPLLSAATAVGMFALLLPLLRAGIMGGADAKLLAALSTGLPPLGAVNLLLVTSVFGSVLAAVYLVLHAASRYVRPRAIPDRRTAGWPKRFTSVELWRIRRRAAVPYGIAIAAGATFSITSVPGI